MRAMMFFRMIGNLGNVKRLEGLGSGASLGRIFQPLGVNNGLQVENCPFKQLINYNEVEFLRLFHLDGCIFEP